MEYPVVNRLQYVCLLVVLGNVVAVAAVPGTATGTEQELTSQPDSAALASGHVLEQTVDVANADGEGRIAVSVTYDAAAEFVVDTGSIPASVNVTATDGFEAAGEGRYRSTGTTGTPTIEFVVSFENPRSLGVEMGDPMAADPGPWALVEREFVVPRVEGHVSAPDVETAGPGYVTYSWVYLGAVETHTRTVEGERITLVVPDAAAPVSRPESILTHLETTNREIDIGGRSEEVHFLALPSVGIQTPWTGVAYGRRDVIVRAGRPVAAEPSVWAHEYAHTRQKFRTTPEARWLVEASADYFAGYESLHQDRIDYPGFERQSSRKLFQSAVLADNEAWGSRLVPYVKGERALAHLDEQIRLATDGERALADVVRRLNERDERVTLNGFYDAVAAVSTRETADDFRTYVETAEYAPPPRDESNYVESITDDPDGDGLENAAELDAETSPFDDDTDGDTLPDRRELIELETDPTATDTDGDGRSDADELTYPSTDPLTADTDGDGLVDARELELATDPTVADTDGDGLDDGSEHRVGSSPRYSDTDGDGLDDAVEVDLGTDPTARDTDGDGRSDRAERAGPTAPTAADTDGDGYGDAAELDLGTDPTAPTGTVAYLEAAVRSYLSGLIG